MLAIRLARVGRTRMPLYRVVVSEKSKDMYGNYLELLGTYNPHTKEAALKDERIKHWISVGAQPSETVNNLLIKEGILKDGKRKKSVTISDKRKAKQDEKAKASEEAKAAAEPKVEEAPAESPAEETKEETKPEEAPAEEKKEESKE